MYTVQVRFGSHETPVDLQNCTSSSSNDSCAREIVRVLSPVWAGIADAKDSWTVENIGSSKKFTFTPVGGTKA